MPATVPAGGQSLGMTLFSVNRDIPARTSLLPCPVTPSLKPKPEPKPEPEAEPKPEPKAKPEPEAEPVLCIPTQVNPLLPCLAGWRS